MMLPKGSPEVTLSTHHDAKEATETNGEGPGSLNRQLTKALAHP